MFAHAWILDLFGNLFFIYLLLLNESFTSLIDSLIIVHSQGRCYIFLLGYFQSLVRALCLARYTWLAITLLLRLSAHGTEQLSNRHHKQIVRILFYSLEFASSYSITPPFSERTLSCQVDSWEALRYTI